MILLTALPRTGKSTAIKKIVDKLGVENCGGFYTEEVRENGERVGFRLVQLSKERKTGFLAHVNFESEYRISRYGVDVDTFEDICLDELRRCVESSEVKYIIIDEIGPMELFSEEYKKMLYDFLDSEKPIIGTIFYSEHEWLDEFKKQDNVNLVEITMENRDEIPDLIVKEVTEQVTNKFGKC